MIVIIGGGISGLTLAYFLEKNNVEYRLFEKSAVPGGFIQSEKIDGYSLEYGPNSLLCGEKVNDFLEELGLKNEIIEANEVSNSRYIIRNGKPVKIPSSPISLLFGRFFSFKTKLKIFRELRLKPHAERQEETLTAMMDRHFGNEVVQYLLKPFIAGIYAGDPDHLVASYAFPKLKEYERKHGSILKGFIKNKGGARRKTVSFKEGMQQLPQTIFKSINNASLQKEIIGLSKNNAKYVVKLRDEEIEADKIVFASSPNVMGSLCESLYGQKFSTVLSALKCPSISAVHSVYNKKDIAFELKGFGALNPQCEDYFIAGTIWSSSVFSGKIVEDNVLLTSFVGGMQYPNQNKIDEQSLLDSVHKELSKFYGIKAKPLFEKVTKWDKSIPQYGIELKEVRKQIDLLEKDNIFVASNWLNGISIEDCIKNAKALAFRLSNY